MDEPISKLEAEREALLDWLATTDDMRPGSITEVYRHHPFVLHLLQQSPRYSKILSIYIQTIKDLSVAYGVPLCNRVDPEEAGCQELEFVDSMHMRPSCNHKILRGCLKEPGSYIAPRT